MIPSLNRLYQVWWREVKEAILFCEFGCGATIYGY